VITTIAVAAKCEQVTMPSVPIKTVSPQKLTMKIMLGYLLCVVLTGSSLGLGGAEDTVHIKLKNGTDAEKRTKAKLEKLLESYDLEKYTFTHEVVIDENSLPHSHPVLTLHTRHLDSDDQLLSTYVHEQLHWYLVAHEDNTEAAEAKLRKLYPKVPVGYPDGANDEQSTYLHLVDCYLEMMADRSLIGEERTAAVMKFWSGDHYRWIYKTVVQDEARIAEIIRNEHLIL
jgi:hypothetical protein